MHYFSRIFILLIASFSVFDCCAQSYVVEFQDDKAAAAFITQSRNTVLDIKKIGQSTSIYNIYANALKEDQIIDLLSQPGIVHFVKNHAVTNREIPNDDQYNKQWPLPLMQAEKAWDFIEHGVTIDNREIVIAILDESFQISHPDLINNIWTNEGEIPNDGIDNDNNGYVDDYYGLHVDNATDDHPIGVHGTKVSGIIGAEGNNSFGIVGVNWKIKLMIISGANNSVDIIEGYNYILDQRKLYNETNGAEGAFVVATNLSAGISDVFGTEFPIWCSMYERLGQEGILSVTATDNANTDVDVIGDMPTTCESEYLITATSTTRFDSKAMFAAYGQVHVDLGSPGDETFSTTNGDGYTEFTGTSAAAPHVAGAIGLLYATNCSLLLDQAINEPNSAARIVKQSILNSVVPLESLNERTVSGGRLDLFNAMTVLSDLCNNGTLSTRETLEFISIGPNPVESDLTFQYDFANFSDHQIKIYNSIGKLIFVESISPSLFVKPMEILNLQYLPQGMYLLNFSDGEDEIIWKFFKT